MTNRAQPRKTIDEVRAIVADVAFMDRRFRVLPKGDGYLLQVVYDEPDIHTGVVEEQHARKWYVSPFSTETEIVETAFAACRRSMEHVVGEHFTYKGRRVYSPHFDIDARVELADAKRLDGRQPPRADGPMSQARIEIRVADGALYPVNAVTERALRSPISTETTSGPSGPQTRVLGQRRATGAPELEPKATTK